MKGWTLAGATTNPKGAAVVDRTSRWGNPHAVRRVGAGWTIVDVRDGRGEGRWPSHADAARVAVERFRRYLDDNPELVAEARRQLAGRDLACFCAPGDPCHADVWLAAVND